MANTSLMSNNDPRSSIRQETNFNRFTAIEQPWSTVWHRRKLSKRKLRQFFGISAPVDVSLADLEKYGLPALLQSNVPLCYFLYSMLEQYSSENLFFYLEVEQFQLHEFSSNEEQRKSALAIYRAFIKSNSDMEVNLDASIKKPIRASIEKGHKHCFDEAREHIQKLMEPCYLNFINSDIYHRMISELKDKTLPYDEHTREVALAIVVEYLDKHMPARRGPDPREASAHGVVPEADRRKRLLRQLTHSFSCSRLRLDFYDTEEGENLPVAPRDILPPTPEGRSSQNESVEKDLTTVIGLKLMTK